MKEKPIVLLDVDGVLADFESAFLHVARAVTQRQIVRDPTHWDMTRQCGLGPDEAREVWDVIHQSRLARDLEPYPVAIESVRILAEIASVYFVTSPMEENMTWAHDRALWLKSHFGDLGQNVISTSKKYRIHGHILVDDKPSHVEQWSETHVDSSGFLWNRPYNVEADLPRLRSWRDLHEVVSQIV